MSQVIMTYSVRTDEILLKSEKRPLNLAVNPYYPGHYTAANTDQSDQVRGLERGRLTSSDRRKLFHKYVVGCIYTCYFVNFTCGVIFHD